MYISRAYIFVGFGIWHRRHTIQRYYKVQKLDEEKVNTPQIAVYLKSGFSPI